ncbi:MAG: SMC-Scp complex subunit ScpB [Ignavibacteria bacterium]|nr:SMC-Scp complex subunit ScpB [Ignavibacteria bacterium]
MPEFPIAPELSADEQRAIIEALIFASDEPMTAAMLAQILQLDEQNPDGEDQNYTTYFENIIAEINADLALCARPYRIVTVAGGYHFATTAEQGEYVQKLLKAKSRRRLTQATLETLAIISYRQPISKPEIESIRGVNSSEIVNSLIEKDLVAIVGRAEVIGRPLLYGTTKEFLRIFGLNALTDLPKLREIEELLQHRQQTAIAQLDAFEEVAREMDEGNERIEAHEDVTE